MGQRLNIEIVKNKKVLANCYYHWSGYSSSAVDLVIQIIKHFESIRKYEVEKYIKRQDLLFAIRLLEKTGAGFKDINIIRKILKDKTMNLELNQSKGRDEGIIEISNEGIEENRYWEESRVTVDIANKTITFEAFQEYSKEEFLWYYSEEEIKRPDIIEIDRNFKNIKFEDIFELKAFIDKAIYQGKYYFYNNNNNKYVVLIQ